MVIVNVVAEESEVGIPILTVPVTGSKYVPFELPIVVDPLPAIITLVPDNPP